MTHRRIIVARWERMREPDGFCSSHFGSLDITTHEPPRGKGWERCKVDVTTSTLVYLSRETW